MAIQLSIDGKTGTRDNKTETRNGKAVVPDAHADQLGSKTETGFGLQVPTGQPAGFAGAPFISQVISHHVARLAVLLGALGRILFQAFQKIASAHAYGGRRRQMKLVESLPLGNRRQLLLIDCGNQRYLVGAGADSVGSILPMDQVSAGGDLAAKGPELVWRRGGQLAAEPRHRDAMTDAMTEAGPALWR